jgi:hypothetical protein
MRRTQTLAWTLIGGFCGALMAATGRLRSSGPVLSVTLGPLGDAAVAAVIWATLGGIVGTIVAARPLDQSSFAEVLWDVSRSVVVAILWGLLMVAAWVLAMISLALLLSAFLNPTAVFIVTLIACAHAVGAVSCGAVLWAVLTLLHRSVGGHSRPSA